MSCGLWSEPHSPTHQKCPDIWSRTLVYIDEFRLKLAEECDKNIQNFKSEFDDVAYDVDIFVAVNLSLNYGTLGRAHYSYNIELPRNSTVLAKKMHRNHRNGLKIYQLLRHLLKE